MACGVLFYEQKSWSWFHGCRWARFCVCHAQHYRSSILDGMSTASNRLEKLFKLLEGQACTPSLTIRAESSLRLHSQTLPTIIETSRPLSKFTLQTRILTISETSFTGPCFASTHHKVPHGHVISLCDLRCTVCSEISNQDWLPWNFKISVSACLFCWNLYHESLVVQMESPWQSRKQLPARSLESAREHPFSYLSYSVRQEDTSVLSISCIDL